MDSWLKIQMHKIWIPIRLGIFFIADETEMFWKCIPDKTVLHGEACQGGKELKNRLTVVIGEMN